MAEAEKMASDVKNRVRLTEMSPDAKSSVPEIVYAIVDPESMITILKLI
jgi:hypothetical protein